VGDAEDEQPRESTADRGRAVLEALVRLALPEAAVGSDDQGPEQALVADEPTPELS
jgi:hypothetical protein